MAKNSQYHQEKKEKLIYEYEKLKEKLPEFAVRFLTSKHKITQSTRNLYAKDILSFLEYIVDADENLFGKYTQDILLSDISNYKDEMFDAYIDYLFTNIQGKKTGNNRDSANHKLIVLRNMYNYYNASGQITTNPLAFYERFKEPASKTIVRMSVDEVNDMVNSVTTGENISMTARMEKFFEKTKQRDAAIIKLLLGTGIRVSELVGADLKDVDFKNSSLSVIRKGEHMDIVYFDDDVSDALLDYVEGERRLIKSEDDTPLFYSLRGLRISVGSVERIVKKYSEDIVGKNITPHKLRSTFGTQLYKKTGDLPLVQDALGHASPATTKRYYVDSHEENMKRAGSIKLY